MKDLKGRQNVIEFSVDKTINERMSRTNKKDSPGQPKNSRKSLILKKPFKSFESQHTEELCLI